MIWERSRSKPNGSTEVDRIPFLSVARSLGDFWSFNPRTEKYTVSPNPDVSVIPLDLSVQKFVVIASDGLWNVMTPNEVVSFINDYQSQDDCHQPKDVVSSLIREALQRWSSKGLQADNIAVLIAFLSEEEPEKSDTAGVQNSCSPLKTIADPSSLSLVCSNDDSTHTPERAPSPPVTHSPTPPVIEVSSPSMPTDLLMNGSSSSSSSDQRSCSCESTEVSNVVEKMLKLKKRKHKKHGRRHGLERELARYYCLLYILPDMHLL